MLRVMTVIALSLILTACGGGIDSYEEGLEVQAELMREMIGVLEGVEDEASAEKAAAKIESLGSRMGDVAMQISELPTPDADEMQEIARQQRAAMQEFQQDSVAQMMKLAQYPVLQEAWMNALSKTR